MNLLDCYSQDGNFKLELYYINRYGIFPKMYQIICDSHDIVPYKSIDIVKEVFPNNKTELIKSCVINFADNDGLYFYDSPKEDILVKINEEDLIFRITDTGIVCLYNNIDIDLIKKYCNDLYNKVPRMNNDSKKGIIKLISYNDGFYTTDAKIKDVSINLCENYNDDFIEVYDRIVDFLNQQESGLIVLHSKPGCGKSYVIRHICNSIAKDYIIIPNNLMNQLSSPEFISFLVKNKGSVFILEDCEQLLVNREENIFNSAITQILNMSDGLMSDIFNFKFICTFNTDIQNIDEAILRKGRCYVKYEFKPLDINKSQALLNKLNIDKIAKEPMTLAEIYNYESQDCGNKKKTKVGF